MTTKRRQPPPNCTSPRAAAPQTTPYLTPSRSTLQRRLQTASIGHSEQLHRQQRTGTAQRQLPPRSPGRNKPGSEKGRDRSVHQAVGRLVDSTRLLHPAGKRQHTDALHCADNRQQHHKDLWLHLQWDVESRHPLLAGWKLRERIQRGREYHHWRMGHSREYQLQLRGEHGRKRLGK